MACCVDVNLISVYMYLALCGELKQLLTTTSTAGDGGVWRPNAFAAKSAERLCAMC